MEERRERHFPISAIPDFAKILHLGEEPFFVSANTGRATPDPHDAETVHVQSETAVR
jgi:hypothetical protein